MSKNRNRYLDGAIIDVFHPETCVLASLSSFPCLDYSFLSTTQDIIEIEASS